MIYSNFFKISIALAPALLFLKLNAEETSKQQMTATAPFIADNTEAIRGFTSINFFLLTPPSSRDAFKKIEFLAIEELKRNGKVQIEKMSVESLTEKLDDGNGSLKNPSLTYSLRKIEDIEGKSLPIYEASLTLKAPVTVEKNKTYCRTILWQRNLYVKSERDQSIERVVSKTLNQFLRSFKNDCFEDNQDAEVQPVFYFVE